MNLTRLYEMEEVEEQQFLLAEASKFLQDYINAFVIHIYPKQFYQYDFIDMFLFIFYLNIFCNYYSMFLYYCFWKLFKIKLQKLTMFKENKILICRNAIGNF